MDSSSETQSPLKQKSEALLGFSGGPLPSSIAKVSGSSRGIPCERDFHFYYNFYEFKLPVKEISEKTQFMLEQIGASSEQLWGKQMGFPGDLDDAYDWLVNVNDEVFERFDVSTDEFKKLRKKEEETGVRLMGLVNEGVSDDGFQLVYGKKTKFLEKDATPSSNTNSNPSGVKMASKDNKAKSKIPFHIPSIPKPQDQYKILVNNANQPFEHVWLQRSEDGSRFVHPLEKLSAMDFVDKLVAEPVKPSPVECTPYKLVEEVKDLKELASKLRSVDEFAVDLEHNYYRSFQGLTCLMQISTRTEDFIVDTLKLRIHIGPYLREVFKDPTKKKVMHGADQDIIWLQRDFGIYVCNMFDTGQVRIKVVGLRACGPLHHASRVLKMERNSLAHLLDHFCGITANKEYQNADWRLRPLPNEMLRYAREDTHYLLHIYDLMRMRLLCSCSDPDSPEALLIEVYMRSYEICMQLYEKEVLTESSYLYIYGLRTADFNAQQLAIVAGLCEWRDVVARAEDESTGFILPNKSLLEIAKQMPVTTSKLRHVLKAKHPYIERNLSSVVSIIRHSMQNSAAFEEVAKNLKELRVEMESARNTANTNADDALHTEEAPDVTATTGAESHGCSNAGSDYVSVKAPVSMQLEEKSLDVGSLTGGIIRNQLDGTSKHLGNNGNINDPRSGLGEASRATVEVQKKPNRAFGALLGNASTKRKFYPDRKAKEEIKVEQIKSSVNLPFHSFTGRTEHLDPGVKEPAKSLETKSQPGPAKPIETSSLEKPAKPVLTSNRVEPTDVSAVNHELEDVILLESDSDVETTIKADSTLVDDKSNLGKDNVILLDSDSDSEKAVDADVKSKDRENKCSGSGMESDDGDEPMSLSDLSSSFQKCLQTTNRTEGKQNEPEGTLQLKPFDYEAARKNFGFGEDSGRKREERDDDSRRVRLEKGGRTKNAVVGEARDNERIGDFQQGRRRQAFPATGNRSATFR